MNDPIDFSKVKRVLVAKLRHHGDVLLSSPLFSLLKSRFPHLEIDAYLYKETLPMLEGHPAISKFILLDKKWKKLPFLSRYRKEMEVLRMIRRGRYDLVINLTEGDRGAIAAKVAKSRYAVGIDPQGSGMAKKKACFTHLLKHPPHPRHTVEKNLDALRIIGLFPNKDERELFFHIAEEERERVRELVGERPYIHIHAVSRWMFKSVPPQTIAQVIDYLHGEGHRVVLTASPDPNEIAFNQKIISFAKGCEILDLSGEVSLKELGAVIEGSALLVSVDSVTVHLASALKKPVVAIFGPTSELTWGPWNHPNACVVTQNMSCRPCYHPGCGGSGKSDCLETLSAEKIIAGIEQIKAQNLLQSKKS